FAGGGVLVCASEHESFCIAAVEAMAAGFQIVFGPDLPAVQNILRGNLGHEAATRTATGIADAVVASWTAPVAAELLREPATDYSPERIATRFLQLDLKS